MALKDAGKVMMRPRGEYDPSSTYEVLDVVTFEGNAYMAIIDVDDVPPPADTHWQQLTQTNVDRDLNSESVNAISNEEVTKSFRNVRNGLKDLGLKNLIDIGNPSGTVSGVTYSTTGGIMSLTGNSASAGTISVTGGTPFELRAGKYHFSGCPYEGSSTTYYLRLYSIEDSSVNSFDFGEGFEFEIEEDMQLGLELGFNSQIIFNGLQFKPMITFNFDEENTYNDFVPYRKRNAIDVDTQISSTSTNPVQNKVIYNYINQMITQALNGTY